MPRVSVIIPSYNRQDYIEDTINSVLKQSYKDFELIVVDDGSTDKTLEILENYGNTIKLIRQNHAERAMARNRGIEASSGEYIAFVDSDDTWLTDKLHQQVEIMDTFPQVVCSYGVCLRIDAQGKRMKQTRRHAKGPSGNVFNQLLYHNFVPSPTPLVRRWCFEQERKIRFSTKYPLYEDWACWLQIAALGDFYFISTPLASYRIHPQQSVQLAKAEEIEASTLLILEDNHKLKSICPQIIHKSLALANLRFAYWYLSSNQISTSRNKLKKAVEHDRSFLLDPRWWTLYALSLVKPGLRDKLIDLQAIHNRV